jgi:hypothetical protein
MSLKLKALITTLILGTSAAAFAGPAQARHEAPRAQVAQVERGRVERAPARAEVRRDNRIVNTRVEQSRIGRDRDEGARRPVIGRPYARPIVRERIYRRPAYLYEAARIVVAPFASGALEVNLGGAIGNGIELAVSTGSAFVSQVGITFADGTTDLVPVNTTLDAANPYVDLSTGGGAVANLTIYGNGAGVSAYVV